VGGPRVQRSARSIVIGCGNPLRQDDAFGHLVCDRLRDELRGDVDVLAVHQLTPELAPILATAELAIFVDARVGDEPGLLECQPVRAASGAEPTFSHDLSPMALLRLGRELYGAQPQAWAVTATGAAFRYGERASEPVEAIVADAVAQIKRLLSDRPRGPCG